MRDRTLTFALTLERFPFLSQGRNITLSTFEVYVQVEDTFAGTYNSDALKFVLASSTSASTPTAVQAGDMLSLGVWNGVLRGEKTYGSMPGNWTLNGWLLGDDQLDPNAIEDNVVVCHYAIA